MSLKDRISEIKGLNIWLKSLLIKHDLVVVTSPNSSWFVMSSFGADSIMMCGRRNPKGDNLG